MIKRREIDSLTLFNDKALVELKQWLQPWWRADMPKVSRGEVAGGAIVWEDIGRTCGGTHFFDIVMAMASTSDLRGYWRLGDGGLGPYADSKPGPPTVTWANTPMSRSVQQVAMSDLVAGALSGAQDDGAVQFNDSTPGTASNKSDWLDATNVWGSMSSNPFEISQGTVMGWVKPKASSSTFDGGVFSMLGWAAPGQFQGYVLGVAWSSRSLFFQGGPTRITGPVLPADTWSFVCGVGNGTNTLLYVNGILVTTGASVGWTPGTNIDPKIGLWDHSAWTGVPNNGGVFYGAIDEVSVWGHALTATQISDLYNSGI